MKRLVRGFDGFLSRLYGIYIFNDDPQCLFRLHLSSNKKPVIVNGVEIPKGAPILEFHLWNERVPVIPKEGPGLEYGVKVRRMVVYSLHLITKEIDNDPKLAYVQALVGISGLISANDPGGGEKLIRRLGFSILPYHNPLGKFSEFWENLYGWALIWAYNESSLKYHHFSQLHRSEIWMFVDDLMQKYGESDVEKESFHT